jgi:hypothetical protein
VHLRDGDTQIVDRRHNPQKIISLVGCDILPQVARSQFENNKENKVSHTTYIDLMGSRVYGSDDLV